LSDDLLAAIGARYEAAYRREVDSPPVAEHRPAATIRIAVVGAHLSGEPLNHQLTGRQGRLVRSCRTAAAYRLYALTGTVPPKPGLVHVGLEGGGASIEVEVWELATDAFGTFVAEVPAPLAIGTLELDDGSSVKGFVCEPRALTGATDITAHGGWRAYRRSLPPAHPSEARHHAGT
jgi:allophanate hydrolase